MASIVHIPTFPASMTLDIASVEAGVSLSDMAKFLDGAGLEVKDIYDIVIPARTLAHRRARKEHLSLDESDKFARVVRTYDHAVSVFGTVEKALKFLRKPKQRFDGRSPLEMLRTQVGGSLVEQMLWQIADGMFI